MAEETGIVQDEGRAGPVESAALVVAAAGGDRAAAGQYLQRNMRMLMAMLRRIALSTMDPDDLLSDALTLLLAKWAQGAGPREHANAYVIATMRNRVKDELKSPRSRVTSTEELDDVAPAEADDHRMTELHREIAYVNRALALLSSDQRRVLIATVVEGRKPQELVEELGRPASAIYSLSRRARIALRRATLRVVLEDGAPRRCRHAAGTLPDTVQDTPEATPDFPGAAHVRECPRCRGAWARFTAISSTFGIVSLLVAGVVVIAPDGAQAAESPTANGPARTGGVRAEAARWIQGSTARILLGVGGTALVIAGATVTLSSLGGGDSGPSIPPAATFTVVPAVSGEGHSLDVRIDVDRPWSVDSLRIVLGGGLSVDAPPGGWECILETPVLVCRAEGDSPSGGVFRLRGEASGPATFDVTLVARVGDRILTAFERGSFPAVG